MPEKPNSWKRWLKPETYAFQPEHLGLRIAKRVLVATLGFSVLIVGVIMIITPGPAVVVIPAGLAILAVEFSWARRWLRRTKALTRMAVKRSKRRKSQ